MHRYLTQHEMRLQLALIILRDFYVMSNVVRKYVFFKFYL